MSISSPGCRRARRSVTQSGVITGRGYRTPCRTPARIVRCALARRVDRPTGSTLDSWPAVHSLASAPDRSVCRDEPDGRADSAGTPPCSCNPSSAAGANSPRSSRNRTPPCGDVQKCSLAPGSSAPRRPFDRSHELIPWRPCDGGVVVGRGRRVDCYSCSANTAQQGADWCQGRQFVARSQPSSLRHEWRGANPTRRLALSLA